MSASGEVLIALVMLVGLAGVVVPVLPGLLLVWAAGVAWAWLDGGGPVRWGLVVLLTGLLVVSIVIKYALPARSAAGAGAPRSSLVLGALGAVVGFFLIPVVGFAVGGVLAVFLAELARLGSASRAWSATLAVLKAVGIGLLVELGVGATMVAAWLIAVVVT
jgi:uncharacterized protein YqgC (DUF456 family)